MTGSGPLFFSPPSFFAPLLEKTRMRLLFVDQDVEFLNYLRHLFHQVPITTTTVPYIVHHDANVIAHRLPEDSVLVSPFFQFDVSAITSQNCMTGQAPSGQTALYAPANPHHIFTTMRALFQCLAIMTRTKPLNFVLVPVMGGVGTKVSARHIYAAFVDVFGAKKSEVSIKC